ncbi:hypothetical protein C1645_793555 [Glomus cerebriforme]|uniref:Uncharacterized protein n=1 Tax=Glomus cerebriforme TaxID=658196 RepID=A0A397S353_9GLOM|nr:hypothetical protein C1645_793555 [Glomus cerebriforme]
MEEQYQSRYNLPPINFNFSSESKIYVKDDVYPYNTTDDFSYKPLFTSSFNLTENKDYFVNIIEDSKEFNEDLTSPLSSLSSSSNSSTTSLSSPSIHSPSLQYLSNDLNSYIYPYRYEPLSMIIPEPPKKEFTNLNSNPNFFPSFNIFLRSFTFYPSGKIDRTWRNLVIWSILLTLLCYLDPFEAKYINRFITPIRYFVICLTIISLIFRIIIIFVQNNNSFKSYIKSHTISTTNNNNNNNNNNSSPTDTETQQQQQDATVINMEQNYQYARNTRESNNENSGGFAEPSLFRGCCAGCCTGECCNLRNANCRDCVNYTLAGCLNAICCFASQQN